jgi:adenylosuccinate lyase
VIEKLVVYPDNMMKNLDRFGGLVHSQRILLALTQAGLSREDSYRLVQKHALKIWQHGGDFLQALLAEKDVTAKIKPKQLAELFDLGYHLKHVDTIFARVFGPEAKPVKGKKSASKKKAGQKSKPKKR